MSRRQGRFATHQNAGESLQRQLTAPAHKWRKAWVAPTGAQPESSYKICRYVKVGKDDKDVEDDNNGDEDEEDEAEGEGEGEIEEDEDEGEEDEEAEGEKVGATPAETPAGSSETPAPATSDPVPEETPPTIPSTSTPSTGPGPEIGQTHTAIPSNAIELTNTAPNHVADGSSTAVEGGIEITAPASGPPPVDTATDVAPAPTIVGSLGQNEEKMEVDEPDLEKGEGVEEDVGLVMGEMAPPEGQKELELEKTEQDQVKETEAEPAAALEAGEEGDVGQSTETR